MGRAHGLIGESETLIELLQLGFRDEPSGLESLIKLMLNRVVALDSSEELKMIAFYLLFVMML